MEFEKPFHKNFNTNDDLVEKFRFNFKRTTFHRENAEILDVSKSIGLAMLSPLKVNSQNIYKYPQWIVFDQQKFNALPVRLRH